MMHKPPFYNLPYIHTYKMYFNLYYISIFACLINTISTKSNKWVDPNDMTPKYSEEWVDPHDMRPSKEYLKYASNPSSLHKKIEKPTTENQVQIQLEMYYKRTINMLLKSVREDTSNADIYSGHLLFKINNNDYERLKQYAENAETNIDLFEVNRILEEILTKPNHQHIQEFLETWFHKFLNMVFSRQGIITIIVLSYLYAFYWMIRTKYHLRYMMIFLFTNLFIYDMIFTWIHLYQKAEIDKLTNMMKFKDVPIECDPQSMNSWQLLWNHLIVTEDQCQKYHQTMFQDILWKVPPGAVITDIFARTIEQPSTAIGNAFANVCAALYNKFPWPLNIIIFPVVMIFFCLMSMIILSVAFNRNLHFNFLHLFSFSNSVAVTSTDSRDRLTDQNVERLLRIAETKQLLQQHQSRERVFVEELPVVPKPETIEPIKEDEEKIAVKEETSSSSSSSSSSSNETNNVDN